MTKLGLSSWSLIVLMFIMGLALFVPAHRAAASYCHYDPTTKQNVCVSDPSEFSQHYSNGYDNYTPYSYEYNRYNSYSYSYYDSYSYGSGYHYFGSIYTWLCGWQYNTWVNFDYNCANDIPAWWP